MLVGLIGIVLPMIPGTPLIFVAGLVYALLARFQTSGWPTLLVLGLLAAVATTADIWASSIGAKMGGASMWSVVVGVILGFVGLLVFSLPGAIVGAVLLYPAGAVFSRPDLSRHTLAWPEIRLLAVSPAMRGQGIGTMLMRECVRRARRSGAAAVTLHSNDAMQAGIRMYERMGFIRAPELDFQAGQGVTVKGFRLSLDDTAP